MMFSFYHYCVTFSSREVLLRRAKLRRLHFLLEEDMPALDALLLIPVV